MDLEFTSWNFSSKTSAHGRLTRCATLSFAGFFLLQIFTGDSIPAQTPSSSAAKLSNSRWVDNTLKGLSVEQKIGQMLQVRVYADYYDLGDPAYRLVADQIQRYHIGSVDLGARMSGPNLRKGSPTQVARIINHLQQISELPLLVGADIERGLASRLSDVPDFPFPMAFGAIDDPRTVEEFGAVTAREARAVGIHWAFAPVADVNSNPDNPIINTRSFGEDPIRVGELVAAYILGAHHNGLLVAVKHFPGHGDTSTDSHMGVVRVGGDRQHLAKYELPPFKMAIAAGADSMLLAHAMVPALDPDEKKISTTSPKIVTDFLKHELGFRGVVITDALEMRGLISLYPQEANPSGHAAIDAIKAGADVLMLPRDLEGTFNAIVAAVRNKEILESRIDESVRKILVLKAAAGLSESRFVDVAEVHRLFPDTAAENFAQHIADEAVTLVRNNGKLLPLSLRGNGRVNASPEAAAAADQGLVVVSFTDSYNSRLGHEFDRQMKLRRPDAKIFHYYNDHINSDAVPSEIIPVVKSGGQVVVAAFVTHVPGRQVMSHGRLISAVGLSGESAEFLEDIVAAAHEKTIVVALGSPYLILSYPKIQTYVCTYSLTATAEVAVAKSLFGEIQNHAVLPVTLTGVADRGFSLPWPRNPETSRDGTALR